MIYYIAVRDRLEKENIKKVIKEFDKSPKIYDAKKVFEEEDKIIRKVNIIISDYDKLRIEEYIKLKKRLIVYAPKIKTPEELLNSKKSYTYSRKNELREILCFANKKNRVIKNVKMFSLISFVLAGIISLSTLFILSSKERKVEVEKKKVEHGIMIKKEEKEREKRLKAENIIFLGDSITEGYEIDKYYRNIPTINSGFSGYCTDDIMNNLNSFVYQYNPSKVIILIGTNDIMFRDGGNDEITGNIKTIITSIKENRPHAKIYVESIYPVNNTSDNKINHAMVGTRDNNQIKDINNKIKNICKEEKVKYIDLYNSLVDKNGNLDILYTRDGLHISEEGYGVITEKIKDVIDIK